MFDAFPVPIINLIILKNRVKKLKELSEKFSLVFKSDFKSLKEFRSAINIPRYENKVNVLSGKINGQDVLVYDYIHRISRDGGMESETHFLINKDEDSALKISRKFDGLINAKQLDVLFTKLQANTLKLEDVERIESNSAVMQVIGAIVFLIFAIIVGFFLFFK
jgi:hypothetical protein